MEWNSTLYDEKHNFVAEYGKGLLEFIPKNEKQTILDVGCGTGVLTVQLSDLCSKVVGVDSSQNMINEAKRQFSNVEFLLCDALSLPFDEEFDVVFSNAVFHWINDHDALLKNLYKVLKPHGLLVCEFGANGNVKTIEDSFTKVYQKFGFSYKTKFNFPTVETFCEILEKNGFVIDKIYDFERPTILKDGEHGLTNFLKQFFASEISIMPEHVQTHFFEEINEITKENLWNGKEWVADYRRLRVVAHK